jgi:hypothetical protein
MASSAGFWALKPKRLTITVSGSVFASLERRSTAEGRSLSNLAAFVLERGLEDVNQPQAKP